jgi:hypothetical protein
MSFILPKGSKRPSSPSLVPDIDARDRFGLRINFLLLEEIEQMKSRFADAEQFIMEAAAAAIHQVGRKRARHLFRLALREPKKGKQPNAEENCLRLAAYDRAIARGVPPHHAARVAAAEMATREDVESVAKHIRGLVRERAQRERKEKDLQHEVSTSLFWRAGRDSDI